jgi:hypothetical protein
MEKLALPTKPTRVSLVEIPANTKLRKSIAGSQEWSNGLKQSGGGMQYELNTVGKPPIEWFEDMISMDDFLK